MSKRKIEDTRKSASAAKKVAGEQNENNMPSPPETRTFVYHQDRIDVSSLYLTTKLADVHFVFNSDDGTAQRIPAHKNLLAVSSDVFEKMFCGFSKENGDIEIVDASAAAFKEFLQFFYLNDVKLSAKHVIAVLNLGSKYNVEKCVDACVKFLTEDLSIANVCAALLPAILYEQKELTKACEKQIMLNTADVFKSAGFLKSSKKVLAHILRMNLLSCTEVEVFEACMEWTRAKSKQQALSKALVEEHLGDLYYQFRFASMTIEEFLTLESKHSAVLSNDFKAIVRLIEGASAHVERFNTSPRQVKWIEGVDAMMVCNRDCSPHVRKWQALDIEEKTIFSTSVPLVLGQFTCSSVRVGESRKRIRSKLSVEVKITEARAMEDPNGKILCSMKANLGQDLPTVSLPQPLLIRPDYFYTICMIGFPDGHYFNSFEQKHRVNLKSNIEIQFYNDNNDEGNSSGLVWTMGFNEI